MSTFVLGPLAIFLTYRAINDIGGMIDFDGILAPIQKLFQAKKPVLQPAVIPSDAVILNYDDEWNQMNTYSDSTLFALAESEKEEDENVKFKAITILSNRGLIGVKDSKPNANLQTTQQLETLLQDYQSSSRITLFFYALSIITFLIMNNNLSKVVLIILAIVMVILFLISLAKSQQKLEQVGKLTTEEIEPGVPLSLLVGFPFYPIIYLYNTKLIKDIIAKNQ
jgi:lipopolysaccharide export system permease protein